MGDVDHDPYSLPILLREVLASVLVRSYSLLPSLLHS